MAGRNICIGEAGQTADQRQAVARDRAEAGLPREDRTSRQHGREARTHGLEPLDLPSDPNTLYDQIAPVAAQQAARRIISTFLPLTAEGLTGTLVLTYVGQGNPAIYTMGLAVVAEPAIRSIQPI